MTGTQTDIKSNLTSMKTEAEAVLATADTLSSIEEIRIAYLGKSGKINLIKRGLKDVTPEDRPAVGALANEISDALENAINEKMLTLKAADIAQKVSAEALDVTMPGTYLAQGLPHPLTLVTLDICEIFKTLGFEVIDDNFCPEVETDYYNFEALNFPPDHPARDMQDTYYTDVASNVLLRSQTSNAQIRYMESHPLPVRVVAPGRVYRNEAVSSRKNVLFHQLEGLLVDDEVTLSELKGILHAFISRFFGGEDRPTRFRTSYFPFTEPSVEMDVECILCKGKGCRTCGNHGWLEILGAGMVDPNVLETVKIDSEKNLGFAFGMGIERLAMLKYGIDNIRSFYTNDLRFLRQFKG